MNYFIVGTSDQKHCDCCGKPELRCTIVLSVRLRQGSPEIARLKFGTHCAAAASRYTVGNGMQYTQYTPRTIAKLARMYENAQNATKGVGR